MIASDGSYRGVNFPHRPLKDPRNPWRGETPQWEDGIYYGAPDFGAPLDPSIVGAEPPADTRPAGLGVLVLVADIALAGTWYGMKALAKL